MYCKPERAMLETEQRCKAILAFYQFSQFTTLGINFMFCFFVVVVVFDETFQFFCFVVVVTFFRSFSISIYSD